MIVTVIALPLGGTTGVPVKVPVSVTVGVPYGMLGLVSPVKVGVTLVIVRVVEVLPAELKFMSPG